MGTLKGGARRRLEALGYRGIPDEMLAEIGPWLRVTPVVSALLGALGVGLAAPGLLAALAVVHAWAAWRRAHPFDVPYEKWLRHRARRRLLHPSYPSLPPAPAPQRLSWAISAVWLALTALCFSLGWNAAGKVCGSGYVVSAIVHAGTGYCLMAPVYRLLYGRARRYRVG